MTHSKPDDLTVEELAHIGTLIRNGLPLMDGDWEMIEAAAHYNALRDILLLWHDDEAVGNITTSELLEEQECRHDKAGSSSQGDYWYCEECGVRVEWIEGMGAGFWSPVSPAPAQSAAHGQDKREKQLIEALQNAEYAIRHACRETQHPSSIGMDFDYEDFCIWAEHWLVEARVALGQDVYPKVVAGDVSRRVALNCEPSSEGLVERFADYIDQFWTREADYSIRETEIFKELARALEQAELEVERLTEVNLAQSLQVADKLSEFVEAQATIAGLVGVLEGGAVYLDGLYDNMLANDADMLIDKSESPRVVSDRFRSAIKER